MFKKALFLSLVSLGFTFWVTKVCFADAASDLSRVESLVKSEQYVQAEQLCKSVVQNNPGSDIALSAKGKLAIVYIMTGRMAQADTEVDELTKAFKSNAELPAVLYGIVGRYKSAREFQRAENLSQRICQSFPSSEQAQRIQLSSGKERAFTLIANGKFQQAEEAVNNMVSAMGSNPAMPVTLFNIAKEFKELERYDETMRIYQKIAQNYPNSEFGGKARMGIDKLRVWNLIKAGDAAGAQSALEKLIKDYKDEDDLAHTVHGIAVKFDENGYSEQAKSLYNRVRQDYPNENAAEMAAVGLRLCDIRAMIGKAPYAAVKPEIDRLMRDLSGRRQLPVAVLDIAFAYLQQAMRLDEQGSAEQAKESYRNVIKVCEIVTNQLPRSPATPKAYDYAVICYQKLGNQTKAIECCQKIVQDYPTYNKRWQALSMMGNIYENLKESGAISKTEADRKIKAIYEQILSEYPDCRAARHAQYWLTHSAN